MKFLKLILCFIAFLTLGSLVFATDSYSKGCAGKPEGCKAFIVTFAPWLGKYPPPNNLPLDFNKNSSSFFSGSPTTRCTASGPSVTLSGGNSWLDANNNNVGDAICNCSAYNILHYLGMSIPNETNLKNMLGVSVEQDKVINQPNYFKSLLMVKDINSNTIIPGFNLKIPNKTSKQYYFVDKENNHQTQDSFYSFMSFLKEFPDNGGIVYDLEGGSFSNAENNIQGLILGSHSMFYYTENPYGAGDNSPGRNTCWNYTRVSNIDYIVLFNGWNPTCEGSQYYLLCVEPQVYSPKN